MFKSVDRDTKVEAKLINYTMSPPSPPVIGLATRLLVLVMLTAPASSLLSPWRGLSGTRPSGWVGHSNTVPASSMGSSPWARQSVILAAKKGNKAKAGKGKGKGIGAPVPPSPAPKPPPPPVAQAPAPATPPARAPSPAAKAPPVAVASTPPAAASLLAMNSPDWWVHPSTCRAHLDSSRRRLPVLHFINL